MAQAALIRMFATLLAASPLAAGAAAPYVRPLDAGWQFRLAPGDGHAKDHPAAARWLPASVPGTVQGDLLAAGVVADPFRRDNEAKIQWVGLADWQYRTTFVVGSDELARQHLELVFDGLDTFADVYLDGHRLLSADNMFRRWQAPVKGLLHAGANTLEVRLHSPIARLQPWLLRQPYALPGEFDSAFGDEPKGKQTLSYVRKAAYQYGWDWGPRIVTEGIWQSVHLDGWDAWRLTALHIAQQQVTADSAELQAQATVESAKDATLHAGIDIVGPDGKPAGHVEQDVRVSAGSSTVSLPLHIAHPLRWWPAGYGAQNRYTFRIALRDAEGETQTAQRDTGLRSIELHRARDAWGRSFAFVVNGVPVFAKGADLIPFDSLPPRATDAQMLHILQSARDANMNMLRVWGGGYYLPDAFYDMADRLGILLWQDFMFGGPVPPYDDAFADSVRQEAQEQVERLRDHPSIVLWCGNNEVQTGWETWPDRLALKKALAPDELARVEGGMRRLFDHVLREVVAREGNGVPYWASSPSTDYEGTANVLGDGDYHYWDVWSGKALPVAAYLDITPRFQSEYGLQSFPVMATIRAFADARDLSPESPVMRAHQKYDSGNGNQRLLLYITRDFGKPKDFPSFVYLSQVMQAEGIELAAEHLRASRPQTMGSLYWQLNDVWPGASWSSIDYYGRWKALQFHARRFYAPLLIAALRKDGSTTVSLVSDRMADSRLRWRVRVMDFTGKKLSEHVQATDLPALSSVKLATYDDAQLLRGADPRSHFAAFDLLDGDKVVSSQLVFFAAAKELALPLSAIRTQWTTGKDGYALTLRSDVLAREVWVSFDGFDAELSDNAIDLLPGQAVTLAVRSKASLDALRHALTVQDLASAMHTGNAP